MAIRNGISGSRKLLQNAGLLTAHSSLMAIILGPDHASALQLQ